MGKGGVYAGWLCSSFCSGAEDRVKYAGGRIVPHVFVAEQKTANQTDSPSTALKYTCQRDDATRCGAARATMLHYGTRYGRLRHKPTVKYQRQSRWLHFSQTIKHCQPTNQPTNTTKKKKIHIFGNCLKVIRESISAVPLPFVLYILMETFYFKEILFCF